ncbi:hypothetical protein [Deinococcus ruber]|uniref:Uncharacterized protein n=1 Tax=Deinococcus ruber TaxID=1848197 RepID=A0A918KWU8_9DEIO|nr:hypothetical protein [Deinococcus ruber]GGR37884.1 hypothetical protein GCM10008957_53970 [Deinococcus ruber]
MTAVTPPVIRARTGARGCGGSRTQYDIYAEMALQCFPEGSFLVDSPLPINAAAFGLQALGVKDFVDEHGVTHLIDIVGAEHYREVTDYITESQRMGISRKLSSNFPFERLTLGSYLHLAHSRGRVANHRQFDTVAGFTCPRGHAAGDDCLQLTYHAGERDEQGGRDIPSGRYDMRPLGLHEGTFELAIFMRVPITHLVVVEGPNRELLQDRLKLAQASGLPVVTSRE